MTRFHAIWEAIVVLKHTFHSRTELLGLNVTADSYVSGSRTGEQFMKIETTRFFAAARTTSRGGYVPFVFGFLSLCISLVMVSRVSAQTAETGALNGTVSDPSGKVVPGVTVKVTSVATGQVRTAVTQSNGSYLAALLPPGLYTLEASTKNFKTATFPHIEIHVTETATLDIRLEVGSVSETVTVQATTTQLDTTSSALGNVTDQRMVENLPLVTRNYMQILGLSPGVSTDITDAAEIGRGNVGLEF